MAQLRFEHELAVAELQKKNHLEVAELELEMRCRPHALPGIATGGGAPAAPKPDAPPPPPCALSPCLVGGSDQLRRALPPGVWLGHTQPQAADEVTVEAWYMDDDTTSDQRAPRRLERCAVTRAGSLDGQTPNKPAAAAALAALGVLTWRLSGDDWENDPKLAAIRKVRNYTYSDVITCCPDKLDNYEKVMKSLYTEHLHGDEEIRYIVEGSGGRLRWREGGGRRGRLRGEREQGRRKVGKRGYFDMRDQENRWIRIYTKKGDMIVVPEGIWHRFTLDETNFIVAVRLFIGFPVWTPFNRDTVGEEHPSRVKYLKGTAAAAATAAA
eukprot:scaffold6.g2620.t1